MSKLDQRLANGEVIITDGAMGTELQRRGVSMDKVAWSVAAAVTAFLLWRLYVDWRRPRAGSSVSAWQSVLLALSALLSLASLFGLAIHLLLASLLLGWLRPRQIVRSRSCGIRSAAITRAAR